MGLKNILLKLEKMGFLIFHQVTDIDFIDEIENIIPEKFSYDVYGIIYYTYEDFIMSSTTGNLRLKYIDLENENMFSYVKEVFMNERMDCEYLDKNTFYVSLDTEDMMFINKKNYYNQKMNNLVH